MQSEDNVRKVQEAVPSALVIFIRWWRQFQRKSRVLVHSCLTILSKDLETHHIWQHAAQRMLMQEQCSSKLTISYRPCLEGSNT